MITYTFSAYNRNVLSIFTNYPYIINLSNVGFKNIKENNLKMILQKNKKIYSMLLSYPLILYAQIELERIITLFDYNTKSQAFLQRFCKKTFFVVNI